MQQNILRPHAEATYALELEALKSIDDGNKPDNWVLSPKAVVQYIMGGTVGEGLSIEPKYYGSRRLIEIAVATLATDRALLLIGVPGTAKTWLAEHLAAAISGTSKLLIQGTSGMGEDALRYGWNYAKLLADGPSKAALVASPIMHGMENGKIVRIEELTRIPSEIQDSLITILSEKILPIPELNSEVMALKGFNVIATANDRDKGVHQLSSALQRRFNMVTMPLPKTLDEEVAIVKTRIEKLDTLHQPVQLEENVQEIRRLITIFRELRSGLTQDGKVKIKSPSSTLSTAEAISVINNGLALSYHFGNGKLAAKDIAAGLQGAILKDAVQDQIVWKEYLETIVKERADWKDLYDACNEI